MDIHIGSIPFKWKEKTVEELFDQYGEVLSVKIIIDNKTRQSKGFGFVTMKNEEDGKAAIFALNNTEHLGRTITVTESAPKEHSSEPRPKSGGDRTRETPRSKTFTDFKSDKHRKSVPPWLRKEY